MMTGTAFWQSEFSKYENSAQKTLIINLEQSLVERNVFVTTYICALSFNSTKYFSKNLIEHEKKNKRTDSGKCSKDIMVPKYVFVNAFEWKKSS